MKPFHLIAGGMLTALLAGAAAAQFNPDALKKMQKEGHKIVEEQQAAEAAKETAEKTAKEIAKPRGVEDAADTRLARHSYRFGANLCLDARGGLSVQTCDSETATQQWALDAGGRLVAHDGRCLAGARLAPCAGGAKQKWVHDKRGRLRNGAQQCLRPGSRTAGAPVRVAACSGKPMQVWARLDPPG